MTDYLDLAEARYALLRSVNGVSWGTIQSILRRVLIPMKVVSDSDLIPVTGSEVKPIVFGAKRRWRSYRA